MRSVVASGKLVNFESSVAEAHHSLALAGDSWVPPRALSEAEKFDVVRLLHEWISVTAEKAR